MVHGFLDYFQKPPLGGGLNIKLGDHGTLNAHNRCLFYFIMCEELHEKRFIERTVGWGLGHIWFHITLEDPWPYHMMLEVPWDNLWTLSFGLSQFHGHGSWLVCKVALSSQILSSQLTCSLSKRQQLESLHVWFEILSWMVKIWMKIHLVNDNFYNDVIVNL